MVTPNQANEAWVTAEEIGAKLSLDADTILLWARLGRLPFIRLSAKVIRFRFSAVAAALEARQQAATTVTDE